MIKIGIGPSSSHTMGPWMAAFLFIEKLKEKYKVEEVQEIKVYLFGSLAKTGKGHGTDIALMMGLSGFDFRTIGPEDLNNTLDQIKKESKILFAGHVSLYFQAVEHIIFVMDEALPFHPNGMTFKARMKNEYMFSKTYYSIGGGFVTEEHNHDSLVHQPKLKVPYPISKASEWRHWCFTEKKMPWEIILENEKSWRNQDLIREELFLLWEVMLESIYKGCHTDGILPGGLKVKRRAPQLNRKLIGEVSYQNVHEWIGLVRTKETNFRQTLKWVSCFALAVNEENASFGKIVTAPTNGASGVLPAVLMYFVCFCEEFEEELIVRFLSVAGEIGSLFKKGATISAALGGCQAEIGVSSAMAAGGLCAVMGGDIDQILMAAEIAMEHHLGLTCDPIAGLVQIPCIERNSMGAIKAITACNIALESDPSSAKVSLDAVIKSMWDTAKDMSDKYKETSEGGLAVNIAVNVSEC